MATEIVMPQMGESVAEGTIVRWLKKVGDSIERDEPLFEISTDKVDAEIPSPSRGVIVEIRYQAGATVEINTVVAVIAAEGEAAAVKPAAVQPARVTPVAVVPSAPPAPPVPAPSRAPEHAPLSREAAAAAGYRVSPVARNVAAALGVDLGQVIAAGGSRRVMKADVLAIAGAAAASTAPAPATRASVGVTSAAPVAARPPSMPAPPPAPKSSGVSAGVGLAGQTVPLTVMRKKIAAHMVESKRTSAHVHSVCEISFAQVETFRQAKKAEYERQGAKLTYLSFILKATADALKAVPVVNASLDGDRVVYHSSVNIGVAVALDWGLIVPVLRDVDRMSLVEISTSVADLAARARLKKLKPEEVGGGTFTITNPGGFGSIIGFPIINQPQVAILCVGVVEKRVVIVGDGFGIRHMAYISLGFDHRVVDGAVADEFLAHIKRALETWPPD